MINKCMLYFSNGIFFCCVVNYMHQMFSITTFLETERMKSLLSLHHKYAAVPVDKASRNIVYVCKSTTTSVLNKNNK